MVSSCAVEDGERLLFFDPLAVPDALLALARERKAVIVLTAPWHERDAQTLVKQLDASLFAPPPDTAADLIEKYGITAEQAGDGSPDLQWLRHDAATPAGMRPATGSQSGSRLTRVGSTTTSSCGSRVSARSSWVTRLSTSEMALH